MPITFACPCGRALRAADEHAGRRVKCPACSAIGIVPAPEPMFEVVEDVPPPPVAKKWPSAQGDEDDPPPRSAKKSAVGRHDDDEEDTRGYTVSKSRRDEEDKELAPKKLPDFRKGAGRDADEDDEDGEPRPKRKKKKKRPPERKETSGRSLEGHVLNGGVAGGLLAMLVAVVWFVVGLYNGWIFYYPPVLFVLGLISLFKGLAGHE